MSRITDFNSICRKFVFTEGLYYWASIRKVSIAKYYDTKRFNADFVKGIFIAMAGLNVQFSVLTYNIESIYCYTFKVLSAISKIKIELDSTTILVIICQNVLVRLKEIIHLSSSRAPFSEPHNFFYFPDFFNVHFW